ncbi:MAG: hypothetical protein FI707_01860 [SAR202 cluster bacterium]|nr:hypothetical protein [Chloroflexota bacterium]MDP6421635.1 hypothetical protein [SAR202 cluster bacterium]HAL46382.1 hypothetical protein [Dehalococcoidia bacterium]MDP6664707.1 hypothetical protein [SAR202 cluster bacterium]MDP6800594.1 hypothetical protein [SAR202 cluster bacterium]
MASITLQACPRCNGAVLDYARSAEDGPMCLTCGWRDLQVSDAVQAEVDDHIGEDFVEHVYTHHQVGRGKPALSGWEREKRRRQRQGPAERELNTA